MKIEKEKLKDIFPYYNNPRDNSNAVEPVIESFKRFGFIKPIIVDKENVIIAGHTRYIAAFRLGLEYVPVIHSDMDAEKAKLFRIADNKLAEKSEFDENELLEELRNMEVPSDMQAFFFEDLDQILNFNLDSFNQQIEEAGGFDDGEELQSVDEVGEVAPEEVSNEEISISKNEESEERLFTKQFREDGTCYMKVLCPYCGNIETIEIEG